MDDIIKALRTQLANDMASTDIVLYYAGYDPTLGEQMLPNIQVYENTSTTVLSGTGTGVSTLSDETFVVDIMVTVLMKDYVATDTDITVSASDEALRKLVEERNTDFTPKTTSVLGSIMNDLTLDSTVNVVKSYDTVYNKREQVEGSWRKSAVMTIVAERMMPKCV